MPLRDGSRFYYRTSRNAITDAAHLDVPIVPLRVSIIEHHETLCNRARSEKRVVVLLLLLLMIVDAVVVLWRRQDRG